MFQTVHQGKLYEKTNKCTYALHTLFIDYTYMFLSLFATIFRVYTVKTYNKNFVWFMIPAVKLPTNTTEDFTTYKYNILF
jgi:hypothetical protein